MEPAHGRYWKVKVTFTPLSTGLSSIQHLNKVMVKFEFRKIRRYVHTAVIIILSMRHVSAIPCKVACGPIVKECVCPKRELNKIDFYRGSDVMKLPCHIQAAKRPI
jgi:hypothetical protein